MIEADVRWEARTARWERPADVRRPARSRFRPGPLPADRTPAERTNGRPLGRPGGPPGAPHPKFLNRTWVLPRTFFLTVPHKISARKKKKKKR